MKLSSHPRFHACLSRPYEGSRQSHLLFPKAKRNRPPLFVGSRLRYWLYPSLKRPWLERASKPLLWVVRLPSAHSSDCVRRVKTFCLLELLRTPSMRSAQNSPSTHLGESLLTQAAYLPESP